MSVLTRSSRRLVLAGLALSVAALPAFLISQPATAAPVAAPAAAADADVQGTPGVTADAWSAGRSAHGKASTATQAVTSYWTAARMKAAAPIEDSPTYLAAVKRFDKVKDSKENRDKAAKVRPGKETSVAAQGGLLGIETKGRSTAKSSGLKAAAVNPNLPYYSPTARTSGKVFFTKDGLNYQCSGTIVNSEGADTVWTAGHCVHGGSGGSWAYNWQFVPAYNSSSATPRPYGTWTANQLWSKSDWVNSSDFSADMGVAIMNTNFGYHIVNYLGGQGLRVNAGKNVWENAFGYPGESPFSGGTLFRCYGYASPEWSFFGFSSETIKIPCDMTRGSSGGAWLHGWDGNWGYLNGVNSRIDRIVGPTIMLSPYFDDTALALYNTTRYL